MNGDGHRHEKQGGGEDEPWVRTGVVRTGRKNAIMARCSSRKKTVLSKLMGWRIKDIDLTLIQFASWKMGGMR